LRRAAGLRSESVLRPEPALVSDAGSRPEPALLSEAVLRPEPALRSEALLRGEPVLLPGLLRGKPALRSESVRLSVAVVRRAAGRLPEPVLLSELALRGKPALRPERVLVSRGRLLPVAALRGEPVRPDGPVLARCETVLLAWAWLLSVPVLGGEVILLAGPAGPAAARVRPEAVARVPVAVRRVTGRAEARLLRPEPAPLVKAPARRIGTGRSEPVGTVTGLRDLSRLRGEAAWRNRG
jgi:hypothetical protein